MKAITTRSPFFNPDDCVFEVFGFFEYFVDARTYEALGSRSLPEPTRPIGSPGFKKMKLTETVVLTRGLKERTVKASMAKPVEVFSIIECVCGRLKREHVPLTERDAFKNKTIK